MRHEPTLAFEEPWQARLFGLTEALIAGGAMEREEFRRHLMSAVADDPERPYWDSFLTAVAGLLVEEGLATSEEIAAHLER